MFKQFVVCLTLLGSGFPAGAATAPWAITNHAAEITSPIHIFIAVSLPRRSHSASVVVRLAAPWTS